MNVWDVFGEFAPVDTPLPVVRGEPVVVLITHEDADPEVGAFGLLARGVVLWCERGAAGGELDCDWVDAGVGLVAVVTTLNTLTAADIGDGIAMLQAPAGIRVWMRLLAC